MDNSTSANDEYVTKKDNDLTRDPVYEDLIVLHSLLMENQTLARETDKPTKLDDIVICITKHDNNQYDYTCCKIKHEDTQENSEHSITWNDLLGNEKKNPFCLKEHFYSYMKLRQESKTSNQSIKELQILTTVEFTLRNKHHSTASPALSNLKVIASSAANRMKYYVTQEDIEYYFEELHGADRGVVKIPCITRYKFSQQGGIEHVTKSLLASNAIEQQDAVEFKKFLALLVFQVKFPHLNRTNQSITISTLHDDNFDLVRLYDNFYEVMMTNFYFKDGEGKMMREVATHLKVRLKRSFSESIQRLSVFHMMKNIDHAQIICRLSWETFRSSKYEWDLKGAMELGLMRSLDIGGISHQSMKNLETPQHMKFIHPTFAEYFFATFLRDSFIQTQSCLLDNEVLTNDILDKTCKIIINEIFINTEYAGIRRFFDRMLATHIPPLGELCPFAMKKRIDVMEKWPVTSHVKFNTIVAQSLVSNCIQLFETWRKDDIDQIESRDLLEHTLWEFRAMQKGPKGVLLELLLDEDNKFPSLSTMLTYCVKEYASRINVPNDEREALAHCITLTSLSGHYYDSSENGKRKTITLFLQWYDPAVELSNEENRVFLNWLLKIVNKLTEHTSYLLSELAGFGLACSRMICHCQLPHFQDHVKALMRSIFDVSRDTVANQFFEICASSTDMEGDAIESQQKSVHFCDVLSLSTLVFPDDSLLKLQIDWCRSQLDWRAGNLNKNLLYRCTANTTFTNPFTLGETMEYLSKKLDDLKPENYEETKQTIASYAHDYLLKVLPLFVQLSSLISQQQKKETARENSRRKANDLKLNELTKLSTISNLLWHIALSDKIISCQTNVHSRRQAFLEIFFSAVGRSVLLAFVTASCCQAEPKNEHAPVIYFPSKMYKSEKTNQRFECWLKEKLEIVWQEKTQCEFIDFLFKNEMKLPGVECPDQDNYDLLALPCLLFSDLISTYIPGRLSLDGLNHLKGTLQNVKLYRVGELLPWDREKSQHKQEQIKAFEEKIQKRKEELKMMNASNDREEESENKNQIKAKENE